MDENSAEIKIDHHNGPDSEVEKRLEEESMAAMPPSEPDTDGEEVTISTKTADLEVEATEPATPAEAEELKEEPKPEIEEKPAKTEVDGTKKTDTLIVVVVVVLFLLVLSVIGAVLAARYFGQ